MPPLDEADAAARTAEAIGPIARVEAVQGFVGNQTFRLHTAAGETVYLKSGDTVEAEARACSLARSVGLPAPQVLAVDTTYLICAEVPGSPSGSGAVITEAGRGLRRLHGIRGNDGSWAERLLQPIDELDKLAGIVPADLARRLRATIPLFVDSVTEVQPVLLHGDLHPRHLYAVGNELTGIIDWGDAMYGDPLFDLARFSMAGETATQALLAGYGIERTPELDRTLSLYRVLWSLMALQAEYDAGGDWFAAHVTTIAKELGE
jgi:aminoglycoside phosphotransferase